MEQVSGELRKLLNSWVKHIKQNHYDKPHLYLKEAYLECAPIEERTMKMRLVREVIKRMFNFDIFTGYI